MKRLIKAFFGGQRNIDRIRRLQHRLSLAWLQLAVRSRFLTRFHYAFISDAFDCEARAVIAGHLSFAENKLGKEPVNYFLRRAIHRLEKGLIMEPRRDVFATDYIEDTVVAYQNSLDRDGLTDELGWATDVLKKYFSIVGPNKNIDRARTQFNKLQVASEKEENSSPFPYDSRESQPVSFQDIHDLSQKRRSVRWYQDTPVPRSDIDDAIAVALQAPSACNRQPYRFMVFDDRKSIAEVGKLPGGVKGFEHNFPVLIALVGRLRAYPHPKDRHVIYVDGGLAAMAFMFALETKGLSSCSINWPDIKAKELAAAKTLNLDEDERIIMFISVGYARSNGLIPYSQKLTLTEARTYNPELTP